MDLGGFTDLLGFLRVFRLLQQELIRFGGFEPGNPTKSAHGWYMHVLISGMRSATLLAEVHLMNACTKCTLVPVRCGSAAVVFISE